MAAAHTHTTTARRGRSVWGTRPANAASMRGLQAAMAALYDNAPGPVGDDAVALREQLHREAVTGQGSLPLRCKA